jgi:hypothetical protein
MGVALNPAAPLRSDLELRIRAEPLAVQFLALFGQLLVQSVKDCLCRDPYGIKRWLLPSACVSPSECPARAGVSSLIVDSRARQRYQVHRGG